MKIPNFKLDNRKIAFLLIFSILALISYQYNFSEIVGVVGMEGSPSFRYFQFIGPIAGGVLGPVGGIISIVGMAILNFVLTSNFDLMFAVNIITMSAAAIYFSNKIERKYEWVIPIVAMIAFWAHPVGSIAWMYPLFWLIPILATFYKQNILVRSFGSTFTAHAIGSIAYLYAFNIPAADWITLLGIVPIERTAFALGIVLSYYAVNTVLAGVEAKFDFKFLDIEKKYSLIKA